MKPGFLALITIASAFCLTPAAHASEASWEFEPPSWDFGVQLPETGPSAPKAFTLENTGDVELSTIWTGIGGSSGSGFAIAANSCGPLAPGASCVIEVTFDPSSAGPKSGQLSVSDPSDGVSSATASLSGTGAGPAVSIAPGAQAFEPLEVGRGPSPPKTFTVANEGQLDLTISSVSIEEEQTIDVPGAAQEVFAIAGGSCRAGLLVPPEGACTVDVTFSPSVPGSLAANLRLADDAPGSPHAASLRGSGLAPPDRALPLAAPLPPWVRIVHRPHRRTRGRRAVFWFRGSLGAAGFLCKLDRGKPTRCRSPKRYSHLRRGRHRFEVWAIDAAGGKGPTPAVARFWVPRTRIHHRTHRRHHRARRAKTR